MYPYDLGRKENFAAVFASACRIDGDASVRLLSVNRSASQPSLSLYTVGVTEWQQRERCRRYWVPASLGLSPAWRRQERPRVLQQSSALTELLSFLSFEFGALS